MALSIRHYICPDDSVICRVPRRIAEALPFGNDALPDYAGTKQKVAEVIIENDQGKPVRILDVSGAYWEFDAEGKIDVALRRATGEWIDFAFTHGRKKRKQGTVVDLVPELKRKDLNDRHRWTITAELLDLIAADIWPGIHGPAPEVTMVKGKAPKKPPLTYRARNALTEIGTKVSQIQFEIGDLGEPDLKGLEFEAYRSAGFEGSPLWPGVAAEAQKQREILAARRTGKGEWYAVLEVFRVIDPHAMDTIATVHEKCATRPAAVEAGRRLMAEKADWFGPETMIEVKIYSALEWTAADD